VTERMVRHGDVEICTESFGDPGDPTVLLVHGAQASMLWWDDDLCAAIAAGGRQVLRYDNRDTGRSTHYPVGAPPYAMSDLAADAVAVLDAYGVERAHVVGRSMAGGIALFLGVDHPQRVATVTLVTTTTGDVEDGPRDEDADDADADVGSDEGPTGPDAAAQPVEDWVEETLAALRGACAGSPYFDEEEARATARRDVARSHDVRASSNHFRMRFDSPSGGWGDLQVPVLVVQGEVDGWFPPAHGRALVEAVPDGRLLVLPRTGHDVPRPVWPLFLRALLDHTGGPAAG
jgi:pimeloyl-ACP methyl ester carboxylesterase